jgi:hypothetical protein
MTSDQGIARQTAGLFFGAWLLLALVIADHPPPLGFVFAVLILLACTAAIYLRLPTYLRWQATRATGRMLRVARDGLLCGVAIATVSMLSRGEPSIRPGLTDHLIWLCVWIGLGIGNALAAYALGSWLRRRQDSRAAARAAPSTVDRPTDGPASGA